MDEQRVLRVTLSNSYGDSKNVNLKNPLNNQSLESISTAFNGLLSNGFILAGTQTYTAVRRARVIVTSTQEIE